MRQERAFPSLLSMSVPLVVSFWMRAAFTLVDTVYAATIGDAAVAAIGLTVPFEFLMIAVWVGLSTALTAKLGHALGSGAVGRARQYQRATRRLVAWFACPAFTLLGIALAAGAPRLALPQDVARAFAVYGGTLVAGGAWTLFWSVVPDSVVKAYQDTRATMWAGIASNVTNLALNTLFVFGFGWGIFGIAFSTVLGRLAGLGYALRRARLHQAREPRSASPAERLDPSPYRALLALAVPSSLTFALMAGETAVLNAVLATLPDATAALAAFSVFHRIGLFAMQPVIAISVALLPYAARHFGEGRAEAVRTGLRDAALATAAYAGILLWPLAWWFAPATARALTEAPLARAYTAFGLRLVPWACLLGTPFLLARPVFEAMQRGLPGLGMAALRYAVLTPAAAWLGVAWARSRGVPGLHGLLYGLLLVSALSSALFAWWLLRALPRDRRC